MAIAVESDSMQRGRAESGFAFALVRTRIIDPLIRPQLRPARDE